MHRVLFIHSLYTNYEQFALFLSGALVRYNYR
jgi:hypothetical protein